MSRRPSIEPFLHPPSPPPAQSAKPPKLFLLTTIISLSLLWSAFLLLPTRQHTHHLTTARSNTTLLPYAINSLGNWTLPLPTLPLTPSAMLRTCSAVHHRLHTHHTYYWVDPDFVDPTTAPRSLTYSLAAPTAQGLAESLLELFTAYALSKSENRTFSIDDRDWPWGTWESYFLPVSPSPPRAAALPCPRSVNALTISHATRAFAFGHQFTAHFELPRFSGSERQKRVFSLAATGHEALFRLQPALEKTVRHRVRALTELGGAGAWTACHIRRGDFRPQTWRWHKGRIPLDVFVEPAVGLSQGQGRVIVISDDPSIPEAPELAGSFSATDVTVGIEGGYERGKLLGLGVEERVRIGKEFLVQVAVVAELVRRGKEGGGVVCAAGSSTCRLLAVMMGWEKAIGKGRWKDVDGGLGWRDVDW